MSGAGWVVAALLLGGQEPVATVRGVVRSASFATAGAVVYLEPSAPTERGLPPDTVMIDQRGLEFIPTVMAVTPGSVVQFRNSDPILHNVFSPPGPAGGFDLGTYPQPESRSRSFSTPGAHVILCHVHPEMLAYVLVISAAHRAVVDDDGQFVIRGVRPGRYRLHVWRPYAAPIDREIRVSDGDPLEVEVDLFPATRRR